MVSVMLRRSFYAAVAIALCAVEVSIALFMHDGIVRPFIGDSLAVMLVYCALRAATPVGARTAIAAALAIASTIEFGQLIGVLDLLGLRSNRVAMVVLGTGFDPMDFVAYGVGALCVAGVEYPRRGTIQA
jgi:hypothetical protein